MFYDIQPEKEKQQYKQMLGILGKLTRLFSSKKPCLYPATEKA